MKTSINLLHPMNLIQTYTDNQMFVKTGEGWRESSYNIYKSEKSLPDNDLGNNGDYYAKYTRRYNLIKNSENFTAQEWHTNNITYASEDSVVFPYNPSFKAKGFTKRELHQCYKTFSMEEGLPYTFSLFAKANELFNIRLSLCNYEMTYGVNVTANLYEGTIKIATFGNASNIVTYGGRIEPFDADNGVYRISVTAYFRNINIGRLKFNILNNAGNDVFVAPSPEHGLFINGAQLSQSSSAEDYLYTNGKTASAISFDALYRKINNEWLVTNNKLYYFLDNTIDNGVGDVGDLGFNFAMLNLEPFIRFGNAHNTNKFRNPEGFMYYDDSKNAWFIKTRKSLKIIPVGKNSDGQVIERIIYGDCQLMLEGESESNVRHQIAMAITLNQQTYNTYNRYGMNIPKHGFNTGGNTNFWTYNSLRPFNH